jgi:lysyl-tRNA synthetase class II
MRRKLYSTDFITDYPKEMPHHCKQHRDNPELTERFELMVCGKEANAHSELMTYQIENVLKINY